MPKLIAFIDGSVYSESVVDHAAWVANTIGAAVDVVHVIGRRDTGSVPVDLSGNLEMDSQQALLEELAEHDRQSARIARARGRLIVDGAVQRLRSAGVAEAHARLRTGDIVEAVQELEFEATLIIVGKRGEAADFARLHLGSNLERIVRVSHKPVLVANRKFKPVQRFMVAFDGGPSVMKAIAHIASGKLFPGLPCHLVAAGRDTPESRGRIGAAADLLRSAGYAVDYSIEDGEPEKVIARAVEQHKSDLLVMGAYGHSRIRSFIIGSTTAEMVRSVLVPVMLFR